MRDRDIVGPALLIGFGAAGVGLGIYHRSEPLAFFLLTLGGILYLAFRNNAETRGRRRGNKGNWSGGGDGDASWSGDGDRGGGDGDGGGGDGGGGGD